MDPYKKAISELTPDIYQNLKKAIEIGKWPNGQQLTQEQKENAMQAVIAYELHHNMSDDQRIGYVNVQGSDCHNDDGSTKPDNLDQPKPIKWQ